MSNNKQLVTKSSNVLNPFRSLFDYWPTKFNSFFDFDIDPVGIRVCGDDNKVSFDFYVPGFKRNEIKVSVDRGVLHIECKNDKRSAYFSSTIPYTADAGTAQVQLDHGVLSVSFDRTEESKPRVLKIKD